LPTSRFGRKAQAANRAIQRGGIENNALDLRAAEIESPEMIYCRRDFA
jgi:hypothetical protein